MTIEAKTLRALAKESGFKPSKYFRLQPQEILEMLKEKFEDIGEWDENKAQETLKNMTESQKPQEPELVIEPTTVTEAPKDKPKRTRRTKAQIAADKEAAKEKTEASSERELPSRKRRKKKSPVPQGSVSAPLKIEEDVNILKEHVLLLQDKCDNLTKALDDISMFLAWFHNVKIDPSEPIEHLATIDWAACVDDQVK